MLKTTRGGRKTVPGTTLRWEDVDMDAWELRLRDAKTEARSVALSPRGEEGARHPFSVAG